MKYFRLCHIYPGKGYIDGDVRFTPPFERESVTGGYYQVGVPLDLSRRHISVTMDSRSIRKLNVDFFSASGAFFASEALAKLVKTYQSDLHAFPADVRYGYGDGKPTEKTYYLVHADQYLPCFDYKNSEYPRKAMILKQLAIGKNPDDIMIKVAQSIEIDEVMAAGANYFFLDNVMVLDPIVSESLANAIREQKLKVCLTDVCTD